MNWPFPKKTGATTKKLEDDTAVRHVGQGMICTHWVTREEGRRMEHYILEVPGDGFSPKRALEHVLEILPRR